MRLRLSMSGLAVVLAASAVLVFAVPGVAASEVKVVQIRDDCDPATFNAAIPNTPPTCVGNGDTTFANFIAQLTKNKVAGAWRFNPDQTTIHKGTPLAATNRGGETHSFTCVTQFGGGVVPILNQLSGNTTPAVPCANMNPNFVGPGGSVAPMTLDPGTYQFQCLIHPWMRSVVTVRND
jgi:plastocyanin